MEPRRRRHTTAAPPPSKHLRSKSGGGGDESAQASDALPLPLYLTNAVFFTLFFAVVYYLLARWREKIRNSTPLHVVTLSELAAVVAFLASFIYLLGFFGIGFVQSSLSSPRAPGGANPWEEEEEEDSVLMEERNSKAKIIMADAALAGFQLPCADQKLAIAGVMSREDEEIVDSVIKGKTPSYALESSLGDCYRAAVIRRAATQRASGRSLDGLPLDGFDYGSILGQCCEMPIGYVAIPVGIAGPLLLDGREYSVPMATTEGCLVASTNRGCKAIYVSGGAESVLLKDGMTRAPVVRFGTAKRAAELKFYLEDPLNFETLAHVFNRFVSIALVVFLLFWMVTERGKG